MVNVVSFIAETLPMTEVMGTCGTFFSRVVISPISTEKFDLEDTTVITVQAMSPATITAATESPMGIIFLPENDCIAHS